MFHLHAGGQRCSKGKQGSARGKPSAISRLMAHLEYAQKGRNFELGLNSQRPHETSGYLHCYSDKENNFDVRKLAVT